MDDPWTPGRSRRWLTVGLAMIAIGFLAQAGLMAGHIHRRLPEIVWWLPLLTFVSGWAVAGAALRPRNSPALGAVLGLAAYLATGLSLVIAYALLFGATLNLSYAYLVAIWPSFLIGWLGLFGARWD